MITISAPVVSQRNGRVYLSTNIHNDKAGYEKKIWFSTTLEYGDYFCTEVADPFVLLAIMPAVLTQQDILVKNISERLYYNLNNALIHLFTYIYGPDKKHKIKIICDNILENNYSRNSYANASGCSMGVDSLSAIKYHTSEDCPNEYRLTHLTYFNIGALGEHNLGEARQVYEKNLLFVESYANDLNLPLVKVESNHASMFSDFDFDQTHSIRNMATVLSLQKLFRRYVYASDFPIENTRLSFTHMGEYNQLLLPLLSADYTELVLADTDKTRTEKTAYIANDRLVQNSLYVCWRDIFSNGNPSYKKIMDNIPFRNCTRCDKCMRTALSLDILGVLNQYGGVFDLEEYYRAKQMYIYKVLYEKDKNIFYKELADMMQEYAFSVPVNVIRKLKFEKFHIMWAWKMAKTVRNWTKLIEKVYE